ncbi:MAG: putative poly A polymerase [uncultured marine phage]|uniref:Putative poly A polymerase n=1 Tax=uncultured marine phage TaxID=707152 RepID=A0A8D9C9E9_9VIRU|nr:MAG: putative poly A polymerase [uncultured marine phage]
MNKKFLKHKLKEHDKWVMILVGTPLVGKSTYLRENFSDVDYVTLSRDECLLEVAGTDDYGIAWKTANQKNVDKLLKSKFENASKEGKNCVVDMTNLSKKRRKSNLKFFGEDYFKVAVTFDHLSQDEYKMRNEKRLEEEKKFIPYGVIASMKKAYTPVDRNEGFDLIVS